MVGIWDMLILAFVAAVAVGDAIWRKIPTNFVVSAAVIGLGWHAFHGNALGSLAGCGLGFAIGLALFYLGAIGGGDVKLLLALGALLGYQRWFVAMEVSVLVSAVVAATQVVRRGAVRVVIHNMGELACAFISGKFAPHPEINVRNAAMIRSPFGVAAAIGTCAALILRP